MFGSLFKSQAQKHQDLSQRQVVPEPGRCVQCGICSYSCPAGIDVRHNALLGIPVNDSRCLTCGECVLRCPRGVLRFEYTELADIMSESDLRGSH